MARKKKKVEEKEIIYAPIDEQPITETLEQNYMPYAMSVIVSRAIPEIDGLKPAHRKLLYTMYTMGLLGGKLTKSANVVGQTMKLNPHGDSAIYETMVPLLLTDTVMPILCAVSLSVVAEFPDVMSGAFAILAVLLSAA